MVGVAQLVRAEDCGSSGRGFKSPHSPHLVSKVVKHSNTSKLREVFISNDGVFSFCFYVWNFGKC